MSIQSRQYRKDLFRSSRFLILAILLLLSSLLLQRNSREDGFEVFNISHINKEVQKAQDLLDKDLETIGDLLRDSDFEDLMINNDAYVEEITRRKGYSIYIFENDSLVFWSDNSIPVQSSLKENKFQSGLFFMSNTWGLCQLDSIDTYILAGILHLQRAYPYENDFLSNDFVMGSGLAGEFEVQENSGPGSMPVIDIDGKVLFYLNTEEAQYSFSATDIIIIILSVLWIIALLLFIQDLFKYASRKWKTNWWLPILAADLLIIRWLMIRFEIPGILYHSSFFAPFDNGTFFFNSEGDLIITGIFILLFAFDFLKTFSLYPSDLNVDDKAGNARIIDGFTTAGWIGVLGVFLAMTWLFEHILSERESLIEVYKVLTLSIFSLSGLLFFILVLTAFSFFARSVVCQIVPYYTPVRMMLILGVTLVVVIVSSRLIGFVPKVHGLVLLLLMVAVYIFSVYKGNSRLNHSSSVLLIIIGAIFLIQLFYLTNRDKEYLIKRQLLENLANEHDRIAEMLFPEIDQEIIADEQLSLLVLNPKVLEDTIQAYLKSKYFGLAWNRYDISANVCDSSNMVAIIPENRTDLCLRFFNNPIIEVGTEVKGTRFYYLDNFDGYINYRGKYPFYNQDSSYVSHLFISLDSRLLPQELGYPDLLISGRINHLDSLVQEYSYAKYQVGKLVSKAGDYSYSTDCRHYPEEIGSIVSFSEGKHDHLIYKLNPDQTIVLSSPKFRVWDHLVSFSYVFVLLYLLWLVVTFLYYLPARMKSPVNGLKRKIEFVMISVLLVSFILIGGGMTYYIIGQHNKTNRNTISEKTQSVLIELSHKLSEEPVLSSTWSSEDYPSLSDLLIKFSYVFNSDINLFGPGGEILASSRPEIFDQQLIGRKMDPWAYHELSIHDQMEFIHFERIGGMRYWSAYVPFYNRYNDLVAYLNLPYFAKQSIIRQEISTFIVAILNAYFLLIFLSVVLAVFLSNQVTKPIRLLQEKFAKMELGGINQTVDYKKNDEIGSLVKSYNRMVDELESSADKLAKSERETAWREMAKQIAHEIKNPLTPMKLSIQHLRRAWDDKVEDWEAYFDRVSQTLVEQIDSLSSIADEFSQFARMPQSNQKAVDLVLKVRKSVDLFDLSETGSIQMNVSRKDKIWVFVDEEQLQQVFNNLFKNAFQSIPKNRNPIINISVGIEGEMAVVSIRDNGTGVDSKISEKLFEPNFTTKTSGMGLGLAITKNIIEGAGGKIWYETEKDIGSTFYISLPVYNI